MDRGVEHLAQFLEVNPEPLLLVIGDRTVVERCAPVGGALVHGQRSDLVHDCGDDLHATGRGPDHRYALAREVDRLGGPTTGVMLDTPEIVGARDVGLVGHRQHSGGSNQETRTDRRTFAERHRPCTGSSVEVRRGDRCIEPHMATQIETIDHMVEVTLGLGLTGEVLLPQPVLEEFPREQVPIGVALGVEPCPGITVPVPGATDPTPCLDQHGRESCLERAVELVDAGHPGAYDQHLDLLDGGVGRVDTDQHADPDDVVSDLGGLFTRCRPGGLPLATPTSGHLGWTICRTSSGLFLYRPVSISSIGSERRRAACGQRWSGPSDAGTSGVQQWGQ